MIPTTTTQTVRETARAEKKKLKDAQVVFERLDKIEKATGDSRRELFRLGMALVFLIAIILYVGSQGEVSFMLVAAAMIGGYMALNIGANDVANNVGPGG